MELIYIQRREGGGKGNKGSCKFLDVKTYFTSVNFIGIIF